ncbi:MAG: hypothetical protein U9R00_02535 [Patescibacteria group bacterium]|nr:hypothetical protein [Patescibacteria group bacterium]
MKRKTQKKTLDPFEVLALRVTKWIGSTASILVHTVLFIIAFVLYFFGINFDTILLVVTTVVSLEAIYLAIFIQMSVNRQFQSLRNVSRDIEEIQKDVDEIQKDVDEIQEDVEDMEEEDDADRERDTLMVKKIKEVLGKLNKEIKDIKDQ